MAKRKALSKKVRFEVFKRDSFKCQYCGGSAPDVVLNADHITPVAEGGDNSLLNLITSCFACNSGKGKRALSDGAALKKQTDQMVILNERRLQIEMMSNWRIELMHQDEIELGNIEDAINVHLERANKQIGDNYLRTDVKSCLKKYGINMTLDAVEKSAFQYLKNPESAADRDKFLSMIPRICYWTKREAENPVEAELRKIAYVANRTWNYCKPQDLAHRMIQLHKMGVTKNELYQFVKTSYSASGFEDKVSAHLEGSSHV